MQSAINYMKKLKVGDIFIFETVGYLDSTNPPSDNDGNQSPDLNMFEILKKSKSNRGGYKIDEKYEALPLGLKIPGVSVHGTVSRDNKQYNMILYSNKKAKAIVILGYLALALGLTAGYKFSKSLFNKFCLNKTKNLILNNKLDKEIQEDYTLKHFFNNFIETYKSKGEIACLDKLANEILKKRTFIQKIKLAFSNPLNS